MNIVSGVDACAHCPYVVWMQSSRRALSTSLLLVTSLTEDKKSEESEEQPLLLGHCQSLVEDLQAVLSALRSLCNKQSIQTTIHKSMYVHVVLWENNQVRTAVTHRSFRTTCMD